MPDNPASLYDQLSPLIQQQQDIYKQRAAALEQMMAPYANVDPVNQAFIAGLSAPNPTGNFFTSLGNAVNSERGVLSKLREEQMAQQDKIANLQMAQIKLAMQAPVMEARAEYYRNRGADVGAGNRPIDIQRNIKIIDEYERKAIDAEAKNNPTLAARYRAEAEKLRSSLIGAGATDVSGQEPDVSAQEEQQSGGGWDILDQIGNLAGQIGDLPSQISSQSGGSIMSSISGGGVPPKKTEEPAQEEAAPEEPKPQSKPATTAAPENLYKGSSPPKEFPGALRGKDGGWYVVKDGKPYPVLK